ncbi:MAG: type II secretion system protein [bacterium]|nr:type II secretion system protein [bacterium]
MKIKKLQKGFTLIEALVYIALVSGILIAATSFAWNIVNSRTSAFTAQEVEQNGRFVMQKIGKIFKEANQINIPAIGLSGNIVEVELDDGGTEIVTISQNGTNIEYQYNSDPVVELNSNLVEISDLQFSNLSTVSGSTRNIGVSFTLSHINPANRQEWSYSENYSTTIELRDR